MAKISKSDQKSGSVSKDAKVAKAVGMAMEGHTQTEIAEELGMSRKGVSKLLNSDESKKLIKQGQDRIMRLYDKAIQTLEDALDSRFEEKGMGDAIKAALPILKTLGLIKEQVDLTHSFPKPTVIKRRNGEEIVLGTAKDEDEE